MLPVFNVWTLLSAIKLKFAWLNWRPLRILPAADGKKGWHFGGLVLSLQYYVLQDSESEGLRYSRSSKVQHGQQLGDPDGAHKLSSQVSGKLNLEPAEKRRRLSSAVEGHFTGKKSREFPYRKPDRSERFKCVQPTASKDDHILQ